MSFSNPNLKLNIISPSFCQKAETTLLQSIPQHINFSNSSGAEYSYKKSMPEIYTALELIEYIYWMVVASAFIRVNLRFRFFMAPKIYFSNFIQLSEPQSCSNSTVQCW